MNEDIELILPTNDPFGACIEPPKTYVVGDLLANVPIQIPADIADHISDLNNPHQIQTTQIQDLESLVLIFENNLI